MKRRGPVTLDVRDDIRQGREPFSRIMQAVGSLGQQQLCVIAPFEPTPLISLLRQQGFTHTVKQREDGDFEVVFTPGNVGGQAKAVAQSTEQGAARFPSESDVVIVDARGLEPPQPLVKILEAVATLPAGKTLRAVTDRRPMHLYEHLQQRGCSGSTTEEKDGSFITHIHRNQAA